MRLLLLLLCFVICTQVRAQPELYAQWKKEAARDPQLVPKYGHAPKKPGQADYEAQFVKTVVKKDGSPRKAAEHFVQTALQELRSGDHKSAMQDLNSAWLIDSVHSRIYLGYGAVYMAFSDYGTCLQYLQEGLALNPKSPELLTEKATAYYFRFEDEEDSSLIDTALTVLNQSYNLSPQDPNTLYKLSVCYFLKHNCTAAVRFYNLCKTYGGKQYLTHEFSKRLKEEYLE